MPDTHAVETDSASAFVCPQCGSAVRAEDVHCPVCKVDLALAAALAERQVLAMKSAPASSFYVADIILPRFGDFLLKNGDITETELETALARQQELGAQNRRETIGQILLKMGALTREKLDLASIQQVRQLQQALQENNRQLEQRVAERTQELQQALQKLAELNQLKVNFVANISHELRTPLSQVIGYVDLVTDGSLGDLNPDQAKALGSADIAIKQLRRLIEDLIRFASGARGELALNLTPVSLAAVAKRALNLSTPKATQSKVQINLEIPASLAPAQADEEKISWVLFQLLDNAIKFTPAGGEVKLSVEPRANRLHISVRDTGIGIPPERLQEIFTPFHQLDSSSTRSYGGTGLGLALVKTIIEAHHSQIEVQSASGQGSAFSFELPVAN
jgi:signal transduction histidine kinase